MAGRTIASAVNVQGVGLIAGGSAPRYGRARSTAIAEQVDTLQALAAGNALVAWPETPSWRSRPSWPETPSWRLRPSCPEVSKRRRARGAREHLPLEIVYESGRVGIPVGLVVGFIAVVVVVVVVVVVGVVGVGVGVGVAVAVAVAGVVVAVVVEYEEKK